MYFKHKPGEYLQVDFAGTPMSYINRDTGEQINCPVLVGVLPFSGKMYVEALPGASSEYLFAALDRCMSFSGGVPWNILCDNLKQIVTRSSRYEPSFSELSQQWALHYGTNFEAARVGKPKDKPLVEKGVDLSYKRVYAPLRDKEFYSLEELNHHIMNNSRYIITLTFRGVIIVGMTGLLMKSSNVSDHSLQIHLQ